MTTRQKLTKGECVLLAVLVIFALSLGVHSLFGSKGLIAWILE